MKVDRRQVLQGLGASAALALSPIGFGKAYAQVAGGELIVAEGSNPPSLDAMATSSAASRDVNMNVYETLYGFNEKIEAMPILAETAKLSDDGLKLVFPLRKGVLFHNGKEMTAKDVKASLERYRKVGATTNLLDPVASIDITGDYEVTFTLKKKTPTFLDSFSSPRAPAVIIPEEDADAAANKTSLVGTGPYKIAEYVPDSHVSLVKFDKYSQDTRYPGPDGFGGKKTAYFDKITFRIIPEPGASVAALEANEVQLLNQILPSAAKRLKSNPDYAIYTNPQWAILTFIMNVNQAPTDNIKFRQAVQVALNMEEIGGIATEGQFNLNPGWVYPGSPYDIGDAGSAGLYNQADTGKAQALLKEAGYNNEVFTILTDSNTPEHNKSAVVIAEQLKAAGINVKINEVDWPTALNLRLQDTGWNGWTLTMGIEPYLGPEAIVATLTGKRPHFVKNDPALDALYQEFITGDTLEARKATWAKIQPELYRYAGIIKIGDDGWMQASRSKLKGFETFRFPRVYDTWLEK